MKRRRPERPGDSPRRSSPVPPAFDLSADHIPVLLDDVIDAIAPRDGAIYVDGTFGAGGYASALLAAAECRVLGIDRDPESVRRGVALAAGRPGRLTLIEGRFGDMERLVGDAALGSVAGVALDLGVSSMQLDQAE